MYIFQQDGATSRTSKVTQEHLDEEVPEFIKKDEWPPQSPDCNPMDYHVHVGLALRESLSGRTEKFSKEELKAKDNRMLGRNISC
jgi:hypothetical protein